MTDWLVRTFVKDADNVRDTEVRISYGILSGVTGICCNVFLFILKLIIGTLSNSISIVSDGFNNLADCLSCIIAIFSYKISGKPADKDHPFGHGRYEYIASFIMAVIIFIVAYQLLTESISKLLHPEEMYISVVMMVILGASIFVKLWMSVFYKTLGQKIDNTTMLASSEDSRNDVVTTAVALLGMILAQYFPNIPFDGIAGIFVAVYIALSGKEILMDIIDRIIGKPASYELTEHIKSIILSHKEILGVHDMIIHDYGPGRLFGSAHAEIDSRAGFVESHDVIDVVEKEIYDTLQVQMTLHMDPIDVSDPVTKMYYEKVKFILKEIDSELTMHDFRRVPGETHTNLVFDVLVPYDCKCSAKEIQNQIDVQLASEYPDVHLITVITFDRPFIGGEEHE